MLIENTLFIPEVHEIDAETRCKNLLAEIEALSDDNNIGYYDIN